MYDGMMGDLKGKLNALPDGCVPTVEGLVFSGFDQSPRKKAYSVQLTLDTPVRVPSNPSITLCAHDSPVSSTRLLRMVVVILRSGHDTWTTLEPEYNTYCNNIDVIVEERDKFIAGVNSIMDSYATLAPALKVWPPLWDLLPEETKGKHKEIVERKKPATAAEISADLGAMTGVVVADKLTGGTK